MISDAFDTRTGTFVRTPTDPVQTLEPVEIVGRRPPRFNPILLLAGAALVLLLMTRRGWR